jgi:hypothetical protein
VKANPRKIVLIAFAFFTGSTMLAQSPSPAEIQKIAERAYIYAYPLVLLQATMAPKGPLVRPGSNKTSPSSTLRTRPASRNRVICSGVRAGNASARSMAVNLREAPKTDAGG